MGRIRRVGSVKQELLQKSKEAALSAASFCDAMLTEQQKRSQRDKR